MANKGRCAPGACFPFGISEVRAVLAGEPSGRPDRNSACGEFERWFQGERRVIFWHG